MHNTGPLESYATRYIISIVVIDNICIITLKLFMNLLESYSKSIIIVAVNITRSLFPYNIFLAL